MMTTIPILAVKYKYACILYSVTSRVILFAGFNTRNFFISRCRSDGT